MGRAAGRRDTPSSSRHQRSREGLLLRASGESVTMLSGGSRVL